MELMGDDARSKLGQVILFHHNRAVVQLREESRSKLCFTLAQFYALLNGKLDLEVD